MLCSNLLVIVSIFLSSPPHSFFLGGGGGYILFKTSLLLDRKIFSRVFQTKGRKELARGVGEDCKICPQICFFLRSANQFYFVLSRTTNSISSILWLISTRKWGSVELQRFLRFDPHSISEFSWSEEICLVEFDPVSYWVNIDRTRSSAVKKKKKKNAIGERGMLEKKTSLEIKTRGSRNIRLFEKETFTFPIFIQIQYPTLPLFFYFYLHQFKIPLLPDFFSARGHRLNPRTVKKCKWHM